MLNLLKKIKEFLVSASKQLFSELPLVFVIIGSLVSASICFLLGVVFLFGAVTLYDIFMSVSLIIGGVLLLYVLSKAVLSRIEYGTLTLESLV